MKWLFDNNRKEGEEDKMEVFIGGAGWCGYKINSDHPYTNEIKEGIYKAYGYVSGWGNHPPKLIKNMDSKQLNEYLLYLFKECEKNFSIELAKDNLKDELIRIMKNCETQEEIKTRDKLIKDRMKKFSNDDIVDYVANVVTSKINDAINKYHNIMTNAINESLYS